MSMQSLVKKKFVLYYKPEFAGGERAQIVEGMDFFTKENGFSIYDIDDIGHLDPEDSTNIGPLMVWRVL